MSTFTEDQIQQLAHELNQSEKSRQQIEHFSKRFPGMRWKTATASTAPG